MKGWVSSGKVFTNQPSAPGFGVSLDLLGDVKKTVITALVVYSSPSSKLAIFQAHVWKPLNDARLG